MTPIVVDTSVWIDFFNKRGTPEVTTLKILLRGDAPVCLCPVIIQEVLQGLKGEGINQVLENLLVQEIYADNPVEAAISAAEIYRSLRTKGITIRKSNDCLIAHYVMSNNAELLENDRDFKLMAQHLPLKLFGIQ